MCNMNIHLFGSKVMAKVKFFLKSRSKVKGKVKVKAKVKFLESVSKVKVMVKRSNLFVQMERSCHKEPTNVCI